MITVKDIQREVADLYGLPESILVAPDGASGIRERQYVRPRQVAMYLSRQFCSVGNQRQQGRASVSEIGRRFHRDHTTVIHGCRQIERFMLADTEERRAVGEIGLRFIEEGMR